MRNVKIITFSVKRLHFLKVIEFHMKKLTFCQKSPPNGFEISIIFC